MTDPIGPTGENDEGRAAPGMPRWVKVFAIVAVLVVVALVVARLAGVEHGPGLHGP